MRRRIAGSIFLLGLLELSALPAQQADDAMKAAYREWVQNHADRAVLPHLYVSAKAFRSNGEVVVGMGITGYQPGFRVDIQPVKRVVTGTGARIVPTRGEIHLRMKRGGEGEAGFVEPWAAFRDDAAERLRIRVRTAASQPGVIPIELTILVERAERPGPTGQAIFSGGPLRAAGGGVGRE